MTRGQFSNPGRLNEYTAVNYNSTWTCIRILYFKHILLYMYVELYTCVYSIYKPIEFKTVFFKIVLC
jgi:hypothetical protein